MELEKYLAIIWRRKFIILITALITALVVLAGTSFYPAPYVATTTLRVAASRDGEVTYEELLYADRLLRTYARVADSSSMKKEVARRLGLADIPDIKAEVIPNTELIQITAEYSDSNIAQNVADTLAAIIVGESQLHDSRSNPLTIVDRASASQSSNLPPLVLMILGLFIGLIGGLGLAFLFENLDKTIYENTQIEAVSKLPTLGKIPKVSEKRAVLASEKSPYHLIQAFHILRANLLMQNSREPLKAFMVVSADPKEGKSTIVANLAYSIAKAGKNVVIIDGDLRRPKMHSIFQFSNDVGLNNILGEGLELEQVLHKEVTGIDVIPSGPVSSDPTLLINCEKVSELMLKLRRQYDYILVDTPSLLAVPDAKLLAHHVDGLILVINRASTSKDAVQLAVEYMKDMHAQPVGVVINRAEIKDAYYYYSGSGNTT